MTKSGSGEALAPNGASTGIHEVVPNPQGGVEEEVRSGKIRLIGVDAAETSTVDARLSI